MPTHLHVVIITFTACLLPGSVTSGASIPRVLLVTHHITALQCSIAEYSCALTELLITCSNFPPQSSVHALEYEMASLLPGQESLVVASGPANWSHRPSAAPSATHETAVDCVNSGSLQWETMGIIQGLSESDFMARQRYLVDHRCACV